MKKICSKCKNELDLIIENFHKDSTKPDGFYSSCRSCRGVRQPKTSHLSDLELFEKYAIKSQDEDTCWSWSGPQTSHGYASFRGQYAHRFSFEYYYGTELGSFHALHKCDNPICTNPNHLMPGTHTDNMRDMTHKGRNNGAFGFGQKPPTQKLTLEDVAEIRRLFIPFSRKGDRTSKALGLRFNVSASQIAGICAGRSFRTSQEVWQGQ